MNSDNVPTALITGGSGGIGLAIAHCLKREGFAIALAGRSKERLEVATLDTNFLGLPMDVTDVNQVERGFAKFFQKFGRLDVLINAAGISKFSPLLRMKVEDWDAQFAVHMRGSFLCSQQALKIMRKQKSGSIFNISSLGAKVPRAGFAGYGAAKAGLVNLTLHINQEANHYGVKATALCPTYVDTPLLAGASLEPEQMISPEAIASAILFLWNLPPNVLIQELVLETVKSTHDEK